MVTTRWGASGGAEQVTYEMLEGLAAEGHDCTVAYAEETVRPWTTHRSLRRIQVAGLSQYYGCHDSTSITEVGTLLRDESPDVVLVRDVLNVGVLRLLSSYRKVVATHGAYTACCLRENKIFYISRKTCARRLGLGCLPHGCFLRKRDGILGLGLAYNNLWSLMTVLSLYRSIGLHLLVSEYQKDVFLANGFRDAQLRVIRRHVDLPEAYTPVGDDPNPNVLFIGRIDRYKGVDHLLKAISTIRTRLTCTVVGDGPYKQRCMNICRRAGLQDRVSFVGWVPRQDLQKYLIPARLVVVPSIWPEPIGRVGLEAMAFGRPVVAYRCGGIPEWLAEGQTGYLVENGNVEQLSRRIGELVVSAQLARELGAQAMHFVAANYSRSKFFSDLRRALHDASTTE